VAQPRDRHPGGGCGEAKRDATLARLLPRLHRWARQLRRCWPAWRPEAREAAKKEGRSLCGATSWCAIPFASLGPAAVVTVQPQPGSSFSEVSSMPDGLWPRRSPAPPSVDHVRQPARTAVWMVGSKGKRKPTRHWRRWLEERETGRWLKGPINLSFSQLSSGSARQALDPLPAR